MTDRSSYRVVLAYDGSEFHGWQYQPEPGVRTVEGDLREAARPLSTDGEVETRGASRTDTGVHALGQCALVRIAGDREPREIHRALEGRTRSDIRIVRVDRAPDGFDPSLSALRKKYVYRIHVGEPRPLFSGRTSWWSERPLDAAAMHEAAQQLVGTHDFESFRNISKDAPESAVRTIHELEVHEAPAGVGGGGLIEIRVVGDGFLYKMVRNLTGTLVDVGLGRSARDSLSEILAARDRTAAGPTAPPQGLFLVQIQYEGDPKPVASGVPLAVR